MKDRLPKWLLVVLTIMGVGAVLHGLLPRPDRATVYMVAVGALILWLLREITWHDRYEDLRERLGDAFTAREMILKERDARAGAPYSCLAFEYPLIAYPRGPFRRVLARHEALLRTHLPGLPFALRKRRGSAGAPLQAPDAYVAVIGTSDQSPIPRLVVEDASLTQHAFREYLSIARRLSLPPGPGRMYVIVADADAVSVRTLDGVDPDDDVTFEPRRQQLDRYGDILIQGWRAAASSRLRERRVAMPRPAASREEYLARLLTASEEVLRARLAQHLERGGPRRTLLVVQPSSELGARVTIVSVDREGWHDTLECFPKSERLIASHRPASWLPVFVSQGDFGGIRWLAFGPEADRAPRPPEVTEWHHGGPRFPERVYRDSV